MWNVGWSGRGVGWRSVLWVGQSKLNHRAERKEDPTSGREENENRRWRGWSSEGSVRWAQSEEGLRGGVV